MDNATSSSAPAEDAALLDGTIPAEREVHDAAISPMPAAGGAATPMQSTVSGGTGGMPSAEGGHTAGGGGGGGAAGTAGAVSSQLSPLGSMCSEAAECSGYCVDDRCCNRACPVCFSCGLPGKEGMCNTISGYDDPKGGCSGPKSCALGGCADLTGASTNPDVDLVFGSGSGSVARYAQIVTVERQGFVVEVRVKVACENNASFELRISGVTSAGLPADSQISVISSAGHVPDDEVPLDAFDVSNPTTLMPGQQIAIVVGDASAGSRCTLRGSSSEVYSGGATYSQFVGSTTWTKLPADLAFRLLSVY
jgi:hypothetical protein